MNELFLAVSFFVSDETGTTSIEYCLLGVLLATAIATAVALLGDTVKAFYVAILAKFP